MGPGLVLALRLHLAPGDVPPVPARHAPVLDEHGGAERLQVLGTHQLGDQAVRLRVQAARLRRHQRRVGGVAEKVRQVLVVRGHRRAQVLIPECSEPVQLHGPTGKGKAL